MAEQSKKITLYIFLLGLFIFLAFFLGAHIYNIYVSTTSSSDQTTKSSLDCAFSFSISNIEYELPELSFTLKVSDDKAMDTIVIKAEGVETKASLGEFFDFRQDVLVEDVIIQDTFRVYPEGCEEYNLKECNISSKDCERIK